MSIQTEPSKRDRQKARRAERLEVEAQQRRQAGVKRRIMIAIAAVVGVLLVGVIGYLMVQGTDSTLGVEPATVSGDAIPPATGAGGPQDPAVGTTVPDVTGSTVDGDVVELGATGTPQAVVFMAHWCSYCQIEAPLIADWVDDGRLAEGVDLVAVSTRQDRARPNWSPVEWLEREGFPGPVLIDPDDAVAEAWGLQGTPMWTFVDGEGTIVARYAGQITPDQFAEATALASGA
ncbi:MAG TPA: TlpA disulfide reductase family protein [Euzebya sp.]|nr:TlpA disulfide reductase family protein [Euzebya sp.]